ncbi:hypothetical protein C7296_05015 [Burkholderia thailandensis]|uniref:gp53-like domain-containing protein n=1 Tax=Burkholderia thailandensis TaxID=57975 RepID=UPI00148EA3F9|nr:hypothetical protein [Burkholderia thailandensis]NOK40830.1 hypothetical protein [Burkholderia thailandensis]NOK46875.1 hypothetical protein [Burkholderia thailandensis]
MTDLVESSTWTPGIRQFETSDPVEGGPDGIDNLPLRQLANRTRFLKDAHDALAGAQNPYPQYATIVQMQEAIKALVASAPGALDTLNELAAALGNDPNFATTMTNALALKAPIDSPLLIGTPKGPTPPQFDNSAKLATTTFVQRAIGNMQTGSRIQSAANATFAASQAGGSYTLEVASTTYALPAISSVQPGATFEFLATVNAATVSTTGGDKMMTGSLVSPSTCVLNNGDTAKFVSDGTYWVLVSGSAALRLSLGDFGSSLGGSGYQKLPNGLIVQWGANTANNTSTSQTNPVTFPLAFPSGPWTIYATHVGASSSVNIVIAQSPSMTASGFSWMSNYTSGNMTCQWLAIGH